MALSASAPSLVDAIEAKLREEEWVISAWSPVHLNRMLNEWYFKDGSTEVSALQVWQDSCQYLYLPRLLNSDVFVQAVTAGCATRDGFAYAAGRDGERWLGFAFGQTALVTADADSLLISHSAALAHQVRREEELRKQAEVLSGGERPVAAAMGTSPRASTHPAQGSEPAEREVVLPNRFYGAVELDATTATMDFSNLFNEVIQHFAARTGTEVTITIDIDARSPDGFDTVLQRTINENCAVLRFRNSSFE